LVNKNKTVSVVIPCFNCSKTITRLVRSIASQTYQVQEIIIVDDCSKDNTKNVLNRLKKSYKNIILLKTKENTGRPSIPRNIGVQAAKSDNVLFMDSDDLLPRNYLESVIPFLNSKTFCSSVKQNFSTILPNLDYFSSKKILNLKVPKFIEFSKNLFSMSGLVVNTKTIRTTPFMNSYLEDWIFILDLYKKGVEGHLFLSPRIFYQKSNDSLTPKNKFIQIVRVYKLMKEKYSCFATFINFIGYFIFGFIKFLFESFFSKKS